MRIKNSCAFFSSVNLNINKNLKSVLKLKIEEVIKKFDINTFIFFTGDKFEKMCLESILELRKTYSFIKAVCCVRNPWTTNLFDEEYFQKDIFESRIAIPYTFDSRLSIFNNLDYDIIGVSEMFLFCQNTISEETIYLVKKDNIKD